MTDPELLIPQHTTSLVVAQHGETVLQQGDTARASYVASVRKSLLSLLYGIAQSRGDIDLDATVDDYGISDVGDLLPVERTATIRDLLTSRSGVYHPPSTPGSDEANFPTRGSRQPGRSFVYNNWDFNAAGAILAKSTGTPVAEYFEAELARPLGLVDYDLRRQLLLGDSRRSLIPAFHFVLSARDLATIGRLVLARGRWDGRQLVPDDWIDESLRVHVPREQMPDGTAFGTCDYGYLWWLPRERDPRWKGASMAVGNFGQFLLVLPELDAVIVHRRDISDEFAIARNTGSAVESEAPEPVTFEEFMDLAGAIVDRVLAST